MEASMLSRRSSAAPGRSSRENGSGPDSFRQRVRCAIERYDAERTLRRRNRDLVDLLSVVGHDVQNEIAVIEGWGDVLEARVDPTDQESLDRIGTASESVLRIVETTGDLVEALDDRRGAALRPVEVVDTARTELERARATFPMAEFTLVEALESETVEASELLPAAFRELLANAVRYADRSAPTVRMELAEKGTTVTVAVIDNGPSGPDDSREAVFGWGERGLESSEARLGLYLVDALVTAYGRSVEATDAGPGRTAIEMTLRKASAETGL